MRKHLHTFVEKSRPVVRALHRVLLGVGAAGLVVRLTVRDRFLMPGLLFYATPWPVLLVVGIWWTVRQVRRGRRLRAGVLLIITLSVGLVWYGQNYRHRGGPAEGTVRIMFWNAARLPRGVEPVIAHVRRYRPDIAALVEAKLDAPRQLGRIRAAFPEHSARALPGGMLLLSSAEVLSARYVEVEDRGRLNIVKLRIGGKTFTLGVADIASSLFYNRRRAIEGVFGALPRSKGGACILVGDFNTPLSSVHFKPFRGPWRHAFRTSGEGWVETWPGMLPLLAIDHAWLRGEVEARACRHGSSWYSDHQSIVTEVELHSGERAPADPQAGATAAPP